MVEHPITLKEYVMSSTKTTRQEYINDKNRQYGGSSKFSFRKYKTDKERLEEYIHEKEENQKHIEERKAKNTKLNSEGANTEKPAKSSKSKNYHSIKQPIMRYKPRTDLERIYYTLNEYSYGKVSKNILDEQLSKLNLNELKKTNENEDSMENMILDKYKNLDEKLKEELQTQKEFLNKEGYDSKNSETVKQIEKILNAHHQESGNMANNTSNCFDNVSKQEFKAANRKNKETIKSQINSSAAKKLMGEYSMKTFFKGASVFSLNMDDVCCKNNDKDNSFNRRNSVNINGASLDNFGGIPAAANNAFKTTKGFYSSKKNIHGNSKINPNTIKNNLTSFNKSLANSSNNNINYNAKNNEIINSNNNNNSYIVFNKSDEPDIDEFEKDRIIYDSANTNYNIFKFSRPLKNKKKNNFKSSNGNKGSFSNSNYETFFSNINAFNSINFNPIPNKKEEEKYDAKSLLYLKNISSSSTLPIAIVNKNEEDNSKINKRNTGFLSNLSARRKAMHMINSKKIKMKIFNVV